MKMKRERQIQGAGKSHRLTAQGCDKSNEQSKGRHLTQTVTAADCETIDVDNWRVVPLSLVGVFF